MMWEYDYIVCIKEIISKKPQEAESIQEKKFNWVKLPFCEKLSHKTHRNK